MRQIPDITGFLPHPVRGISAVFAILFAGSTVLHIWQSSKYKSWRYTWLLPSACLIFTAGFICREYTAHFPTSDATFSSMQGLLYSAVHIITFPPYFFLLHLLATHFSPLPIRPKYVHGAVIGFFAAIISTVSQGTSSFFNTSATDGAISSGLALLKASLIMQLFLNVFFITIAAIFYCRCSSKGILQQSGGRSIKIVTFTLSISVALALVRNIFRTVQIFLPSDSPAWTAESYFWVFDAIPMLAFTLLLHALHPGKYIQIENDCCVARVQAGRDSDIEIRSGSAGPQTKI